MTRLYEREIKDFFEVAKIKMAGTSKDGKGKFGKISLVIKLYLFIKRNSCFVDAVTPVTVCLVPCYAFVTLFVMSICFVFSCTNVTPHLKCKVEFEC